MYAKPVAQRRLKIALWGESRARRNLLVLSGLALLSGPSAMEFLTGRPFSPVQSVRGFLALMQDRSPGARTTAELTKTEEKSQAIAAADRTLPSRSNSAPVKATGAVAPAALVPPTGLIEQVPLDYVASVAPLPDLFQVPPSFSSGLPPPAGSGGIPPNGGGGVPGLPGGGSVMPPGVSPPAPVPEPATWLMLLSGFGMLGFRARRRARKVELPGLTACGPL
jgi:hypothetical protein